MNKKSSRRPGYDLYCRLAGLPLGRWLFTRIICFKAPYFSNIRPLFQELRPGLARVTMKKRRAVKNHIGTVHALAMGNLCELAAGLVTEASLPLSVRWIPRGMTIEYLQKAETALEATATVEVRDWPGPSDAPVSVSVKDVKGQEVVRAIITMYVSPSG
jgi:acyl-coenzyme A thioesterase PaaI-like protein